MNKPYFRTLLGASLVLLGTLIGSVVVGEDASTESNGDNITQLKHERVDTLREVVAELETRSKSAAIEAERLFAAHGDLIDAQLKVVRTKSERLVLLKEHVDLAKQREAIAEQRFRVAMGGRVEMLQAKATRLQREIALLQETDR